MTRDRIRVCLRTSFGDETQDFDSNLRLIDVCRILRVPFGAVSPLATAEKKVRRVVGLYRRLDDLLAPMEELVIQFDRNLNYLALLSDNVLESTEPLDTTVAVSEYLLPSDTYGYVAPVELAADDCEAFVREAVGDFIEQYSDLITNCGSLVVGTSGGGDSNALMKALVDATEELSVEIVPVMLLGVPEWDAAVRRAEAICGDLGLSLWLVPTDRVNRILGRPASRPDWIGDFKKSFPEDDYDVIGTLAIRLALSEVARQLGTTCIVTGLNLEDIVAECLLRITQGKLPLSFPVRSIDDMQLLYPIYRVPKKILDGCNHTFALANYESRSIGAMMGRAIPYYLAQSLNGIVPGIEFDLVEGFRQLPHVDPMSGNGFDFATLSHDGLSDEVRDRWLKYIAGDAPT